MRCISVILGIFLTACTALRPMPSAPAPARLENYLNANRHATLRIVDSSGRAHWFYDAELRGDTLHGSRQSFLPREEIALPLDQITGVSAQRFSAGQTAGLLGAALAVVAVLALTASKAIP